MNKIYWITRLDIICSVALMLAIIGILCGIITYIAYQYNKNSEWISDINDAKFYHKISKIGLSIGIICMLIVIFTPSKQDMLLIYDIGGTIDYIESNDKAKQLPDKVIDTCDAYLE